MKKTLVLLLLCLLPPLTLLAQRISRDYRDCPMTSVLADLSRTTTRQRIIFIHNDLEDYLVTQRFDSLTVADAIRACIGHYPISLTVRGDSILLVECMQKTKYKLIGRLVDERNIPVADANITLTTDTTTVARGISNQSGRFIIPTNAPDGTLHVSHVAYQPLSLHYTAGDIGTLRLKPADIRLDSVSVTASTPTRAESRYLKYADKIAKEVWGMKMPQFHIDTLPAKYRHANAVVLADYDCIEYRIEYDRHYGFFAQLTNLKGMKWIDTRHFHRTRYYVNSLEAAERLSLVSYSLRTDVTDVTFHKTTVMGIMVTGRDGDLRLVNTYPYFKPKVRHREATSDTTGTIPVGQLKPGDILDVFIYHNFQEPISPYELKLPADYPVLSYEGRAVADRKLHLKCRETRPIGQRTTEENDGRDVIVYTLSDYNQPQSQPASVTVEVNLK